MAEYGIVLVVDGIKGNFELNGYKGGIAVNSVSFGSSSVRTGYGIKERRISVDQGEVSLDIAAGVWVAELQQACYISKNLKKVVITQLAQAVDKKSTAEPAVVQKVTLTNPVVMAVNQAWDSGDGPRVASVSLMFEKILFEIGTKPADFTLRNFTAGAV